MKTEWNPRYVLYAKANKQTPEEMLISDDNTWPGGKMCGFILWIGEKWNKFDKLFWNEYGGLRLSGTGCHFDKWLEENYI